MITTLLFDLVQVLLFPKNKGYKGTLNQLYLEEKKKQGFKFFDVFEVNNELYDYLMQLKKDCSINLFTSSSIYEEPAIKEIMVNLFDNIYSQAYLALDKEAPTSYKIIAKSLGVKPEQIIFVDDQKENVEAAHNAGITAIQYLSNRDLFDKLGKLLKK